ncbi:MAG TPA: hypothetical protein VEI97_18660, partial [bacterium]|nr:hypothetical protein [bacterium]
YDAFFESLDLDAVFAELDKEDTSPPPSLGALVWYQVSSDAAVRCSDLNQKLLSMTVDLPRPRARVDALRRALKDMKESFTKMEIGSIVCEADYIPLRVGYSWDVILRQSGTIGFRVMTLRMSSAKGDISYQITVENEGASKEAARTLLVYLQQRSDFYLNYYDTSRIYPIIDALLRGVDHLKVRPSTVYVRAKDLPYVYDVMDLFEGMDRGRVLFSSYDLEASAANVQALKRDAAFQINETLDPLRDALLAYDVGDKTPNVGSLRDYVIRLDEIQQALAKFPEIVTPPEDLETLNRRILRLYQGEPDLPGRALAAKESTRALDMSEELL